MHITSWDVFTRHREIQRLLRRNSAKFASFTRRRTRHWPGKCQLRLQRQIQRYRNNIWNSRKDAMSKKNGKNGKQGNYEPKPEHKFSFGLWTLANRGRD